MITTELHKLPLQDVRNLYKEYLVSNGKGQSTVQTYTSDTFYLWNKVSKEFFWEVVCSDDFDKKAKAALLEALTKNSSGQVDDLVVGYVAVLKMFRSFVIEYDGEIDTTNITLESNLREDIQINSIGILYMALAIEEEFGIQFTNEEIQSFKVIKDVVDTVESKK